MNGPNDGSPESFSASGRCKVRCRETICVADSRFLCPFFRGYSGARVRTLIIAAAGIVNRVVDGYHKTSASFAFDGTLYAPDTPRGQKGPCPHLGGRVRHPPRRRKVSRTFRVPTLDPEAAATDVHAVRVAQPREEGGPVLIVARGLLIGRHGGGGCVPRR